MSIRRSILVSTLPVMLLGACGGEDGGTTTPPMCGDPPDAAATPSPSPSAPTPSPSPEPSPTPTATPDSERDSFPMEASGLEMESLLIPYPAAKSAKPDVVGAFRFNCGPGQLSWNDPIVYPGQTGRAHLHQFFGNLDADANSTYASLRRSGKSTCRNELNRSAYWIPALLDGKGNAVRPNSVVIYYKRRPADDPWFDKVKNYPRQIPRGLRYIFGWDHLRASESQPENTKKFQWKCLAGQSYAASGTMDEALSACKAGDQLILAITSPECWDGTNLDSTDHRSHMTEQVFGEETNWQRRCPDSHPYVLPAFTMTVYYKIGQDDNLALWHLSSDGMLPSGSPRGSSMHADWLGAWEDDILEAWHESCINKLLNCSSGDLGDGRGLVRGSSHPTDSSPRLVPIPDRQETWRPPLPQK